MGSVARISITPDGPSLPLSRHRKPVGPSSPGSPAEGRTGGAESPPRRRPVRCTLLELVTRVQDRTRSDREAVALITRLLRRRRVVLRGVFAGASFRDS
jgi:hypothetical protein